MVILAMLFGMALLAMGICYIFSLLAKAAGKKRVINCLRKLRKRYIGDYYYAESYF